MSSTLKKIGKYLESKSLNELCFELLKALHSDSENLIIRNFISRQQGYIHNICGDNPFTFSLILDELKTHDIVYYDTYTDILVLSGLNHSFVRSLSFINSFKRKFRVKNLSVNYLTAANPYKKGFRVPSSIFPYLTGAPLPDLDKRALLKSNNPELICLEEQRRSLSKEVLRVYCAFISLADKDGLVECDSCHTVYLSFVNQFGLASFNHQSWYNAVKKLIDLRLLISTPTGYQVTYISQQSKERFVIVPMVVFEKDFKDLEVSSIRMFFEIIFSLNNGENYSKGKLDNLKEDKAFFIKFSGSGADSIDTRDKIKRTMIQIRKRYAGELIRALIGKDQIAALRRYFNFDLMPGCVFMIKIKPEYYIPKDIDYVKDIVPLKTLCHKRILTLNNFFNEIGYLIDQTDILRIWRLLQGKTVYKIKKILAAIKEKAQSDYLNISSLHLFIASL